MRWRTGRNRDTAFAHNGRTRTGMTGAPPGEIVSEREMATKDEERAARLKAALRDNLRRRKAQARSRADDAPEPTKTQLTEPAEKS